MLICLVLWGLKPLQGVSKLLALVGAKQQEGTKTGGRKKKSLAQINSKQHRYQKPAINHLTQCASWRTPIWLKIWQTIVSSTCPEKLKFKFIAQTYCRIFKCAQVKVTLFKTQTQCMNGHFCWFLCAEDKGGGVVLPHNTVLLPSSSTYDTMLS